jgi:hypothetical protein
MTPPMALMPSGWCIWFPDRTIGRVESNGWGAPTETQRAARWPRTVAHPGLPQTRTCTFSAYGSSDQGLAARAYTEWTTFASGSG